MKQTAVEFLKEKLTYVFVNDKSFNELFEQAKQMEKEQIKDAYVYGVAYGIDIEQGLHPDNYYNETFKSE